MWIIARLLIGVAALLYRVFFRRTPKAYPKSVSGISYHHTVTRDKKGRKTSEYIESPLRSPCVFCLTAESTWDRIFKSIGLAQELSTGDAQFDQHIYITGDNPLIATYISGRSKLREYVIDTMSLYATSISVTGTSLRLEIKEAVDGTHALDALVILTQEFSGLSKIIQSPFIDTFYQRTIIAEAIIYSVAGYGYGGMVEYAIRKEDYHLEPWAVLYAGLALFIVASVISAIALFTAFRGSSRGHRILLECSLMLMLGLPVASVEATSDINRGLDTNPGASLTRTILHTESRLHRGRRGRAYHTYHIFLNPQETTFELNGKIVHLPSEIQVSYDVYSQSKASKVFELVISPGTLGIPWYRSQQGIPIH